LLHDAHLFDSVDPIVIEELVMKLQSRTFLAGDMIIRQGERSEWMGLVLKGKLAVMQNKKVLRVLSPGSHVGKCIGV
jgi:CRP-like cAMP-binding protein